MSSESRAKASAAAAAAAAAAHTANPVHWDRRSACAADELPERRSYLKDAFEETVDRIASTDMRWIMHGSGDVAPDRVDEAAAHFLASLTTQYVTRLVDAAVDDFLGMFSNRGRGDDDEPFRVPPPPFPQHRLPAKPHPFIDRGPKASAVIFKASNNTSGRQQQQQQQQQPPRKKPKRKMRQEYWDDPLPTPKIRKRDDDEAVTAKTSAEPATTTTKVITAFSTEEEQDGIVKKKGKGKNSDKDDVPIGEWVGAIGVDLHANSIRRAHMPLGLSAPNFVFPICHDVYAYGRVRHIQAAKRSSVDPMLLQDNYLQEFLQEEGLTRFQKHKGRNGAKSNDDDDDNEEAVVDPPSWPDIEELLYPGFRSEFGLLPGSL